MQRESRSTVVRTHDLTKEFDGRTVVNGTNLVVRPGEVYGFLGPNGAGKTTTIRMILGLLRPTSGSVELFGVDSMQGGAGLRRRLGVVGEVSFLYDDMTALEYLMFFARLHRVADAGRRAEELLSRFELLPYAHLLAKSGITVNAVAPALIETEMVRGNPSANKDLIPIGRFGTVEEVAELVVLLARNGYITGQTINVNGGWYMT